MDESVDVVCPYCGEPSSVGVGIGEEDEEYAQDCPVCCRPWTVRIRYRRDGTADVTVSAEGE